MKDRQSAGRRRRQVLQDVAALVGHRPFRLAAFAWAWATLTCASLPAMAAASDPVAPPAASVVAAPLPAGMAETVLPDTPEPQKTTAKSKPRGTKSKPDTSRGPVIPQAETAAAASVMGTVLDATGAAVPRANITLVATGEEGQRVLVSDASGNFEFSKLPPGMYRLTVVADGLETYISNEIRLAAGERFAVPPLSLAVEPTSTDVTVVATQEQVAEAQIKQQEKQRILGVIPNFYTSYVWDAAPLKKKQKLELTYKSLVDPIAFASTAVVAGIEQAHNTFPGYGDAPSSYFIRYAAAYGDTLSFRLIGLTLLPSVLHQDPRYFYLGTGSVAHRSFYAVSRTLVTRSDHRTSQINFSRILAGFAAAGISNAYHDPGDRRTGLTIRNGFIVLGTNMLSNLLREFVSRGLTPNVPDYATGRPEGETGTQPVRKPQSK